jgi:predicted nuclease of restriction endonuclease-like (RecB) superfamily
VQEVLAQLPWYHQLALLDKLPSPETRQWYAAKAIEHNWSRNILAMQIETRLMARSGTAVTNFDASLPKPQSDLARESLKDPYRFDFLGLTDEAQEREIEKALVKHVTEFLLELGAGFAFVGRQVLLDVGGDEFFIDLLFYHLKLRCYVVIELKGGKFKPEHLGQLGFYLTAIDRQVKNEHDNPTIGLLLCKTKNKIVAEYALGAARLLHADNAFIPIFRATTQYPIFSPPIPVLRQVCQCRALRNHNHMTSHSFLSISPHPSTAQQMPQKLGTHFAKWLAIRQLIPHC